VPKVFGKFDLAAVPLRGKEAEGFITSSNLDGLPQACYEGQGGLGLVKFEGGTHIINPDAPCAQEILSYIEANRLGSAGVTGKALETVFKAKPYGWSFEAIALIVSALFRGGRLEITFQGRRLTNIKDHGAREVFSTVPAFRSAGFSPRQGPLDLETLKKAHETFTRLYGREARLEEGSLADAIRDAVRAERERLLPLYSDLRASQLPGASKVEELANTLKGICESNSEDAIKTFAQLGPDLLDGLETVRVIGEALNQEAIELFDRARRMIGLWPSMRERLTDDNELQQAVDRVRATLEAESWADRLPDLARDVHALEEAYTRIYRESWAKRATAYQDALDEVRSLAGFEGLPDLTQEEILRPLITRIGQAAGSGDALSAFDGPSLSELETDIIALPTLKEEAIARCVEATAQSQPVVRVKAKRFFGPTLTNEEELEKALDLLRTECLKLIQEGKLIVIE